MKIFWSNEVKIGLITVVSLVLLYFGFNYLKGINVMQPANFVYTTFSNVSGLTVSSPVTINGYPVGVVREVRYNYQENKDFVVQIGLDNKIRLPKGSKVVMAIGLMGGAELSIVTGLPNGEYETKGATLESEVLGGLLGELQNNLLPAVSELVPKLDSILNGVNQLVSNPAIAQSLENLEKTTHELKSTSVALNHFMQHDFQPIVGNIKRMSDDLSGLTADISKMPLTSMVNSLDVTIKSLEATSKQLHSKDNTVGLLLNDRTLYDNLTNTMGSANELLVDLKANPKRYVHFSLWGRK